MAAAALDLSNVSVVARDPIMRASLIAEAPSLDDESAQLVLDFSDATSIGETRRWVRYGIGAGVGLLVGVVIGYVAGR